MTRLLIIFLICFTTLANNSARRKQLISIIDNQINELSRLARVSGGNNPVTLLRIAEAYLEKGRILRDQENDDFFKLPIKTRSKVNKSSFFKNSRSYFKRAQSTGYQILKRFPNFKYLGEVYYILAFNEKENGNHQRAKGLLKKAISKSNRGSEAFKNSNVAIADIYFGDGSYKSAKYHYDAVLPQMKADQWYTRYLYNLSWANYRLGNKRTAERQMQEVYSKSKNPKYVNKRDMAERDLGYFYTDQGNLKKARTFYKKVGGNTAKNFYDMGMFLKGKQRYTKALSMFNSAYLIADSKYKALSVIEILNILDKYNKNKPFVARAKEASNMRFSKDEKKEVLYYISRRASIIQKQLSLSYNKKRPTVLKSLSQYSAELYQIAAKMDPSLREKSYFYAGESYYAGRQYQKALGEYDKVRKIGNNSKFYRRAIEGMLLVLDRRELPKNIRLQYFEGLYVDYIKSIDNKATKGRAVEKLYSFYYEEKNDLDKAKSVFFQYQKIFPNNRKKLEAMIAILVDQYKKQNKNKEMVRFVKELKGTNLALSGGFVKRLNRIILTTQFSDIEKSNKKGDKVLALKGYLAVYKDPESSEQAKSNSAYNISVLFYELGNQKFMYNWALRAIKEMKPREVSKFFDSYELMINQLLYRQSFEMGLVLSANLLNSVCSVSVKGKESILENYVVLGTSHYSSVGSIEEFAEKQLNSCRYTKGARSKVYEHFLEHFIDVKDEVASIGYYRKIRSTQVEQIDNAAKIERIYVAKGKRAPESLYRDINSLYKSIGNRREISSYALDIVALDEVRRFEDENKRLKANQLSFPEATYNKTLQQKFQQLDRMTKSAINILKIGSGEAMVKTYLVLIDAYQSLADEMTKFTPPNKSADYIATFKKTMANISSPLYSKVSQFKGEMENEVNNRDVLVESFGDMKRGSIEYLPQTDWAIMDRGGK